MTENKARVSWYEKTRFNLHLDHHATPEDSPELGSGLEKEKLRALLRRMKPDMVQYHSMGHPGWALCETGHAIACPTLKKDFLKIWSDVCREEGIKFGLYYSSGIAEQVSKRHPEWKRVKPDGSTWEKETGNGGPLCFNSPYVDEMMIPFLKELMGKYDVSHFWFDGDMWSIFPCWCAWCKEKFTAKHGYAMPEDMNHPKAIRFQYDSYNEYMAKIKKGITDLKPGILLCSNWAYTLNCGSFMDPPDAVDWLSGDTSVNLSGLRRAGAEASYLSTLDLPFDIMTWDRYSPEYGKTACLPKSAGILKAESSTILAHGGRVFLWHNPNTDCSLYETQWDTACEVADFARSLAPFTVGNRSIARTGVLCASSSKYLKPESHQRNMDCVYAAAQMLQELMIPYDIFNEPGSQKASSRYDLIIVPEAAMLEEDVARSLEGFVAAGGKLVMAGLPGMTDATGLVQKLCGVEHRKETAGEQALRNGNKTATSLFFRLKDGGIYELGDCAFWLLKPVTAEVKQEYCKSLNDPAGDGRPLLLERKPGKGIVVTLTCGLCSAFFNERYPKYRDYLGQVLDVISPRQIYIDTIYPVEVVLNRKDGSIYAHFVNNNTGRANDFHNQHVEDMLPSVVKGFKVSLDKPPRRAVLLPENKETAIEYKDGYAGIVMNREFKYYTAVRFDF